jgi:hypothetical protein
LKAVYSLGHLVVEVMSEPFLPIYNPLFSKLRPSLHVSQMTAARAPEFERGAPLECLDALFLGGSITFARERKMYLE